MPRFAQIALILAPALVLSACGGTPDTPGAKAAHARHESFEALGKAFKSLREELTKGAPDLAVVKQDAASIKTASAALKTWFPAGSGPADGVRTDALAEVWAKPDQFGQAAIKFSEAASTLDAAAEAGDLAAVRGAAGPLGAACKGCHEQFRQKD